MLSKINNEHKETEAICESMAALCSDVVEEASLLESRTNLNQVIKKILITNKEIPSHLATVIAKTALFSKMMEEIIDRKKRYKKHSLLAKVYDHITNKTAQELSPATSEQVDNISVDIIALTKEIINSLRGNALSVDDVQQTFNAIISRLTITSSERTRLDTMKLASLIIQSNQNTAKRKEVISKYFE